LREVVVGWWFAEGIELEVAMKAQNILFLFIMLLDSIRLTTPSCMQVSKLKEKENVLKKKCFYTSSSLDTWC